MHQKLAKDGLTLITVSVDSADDEKAVAKYLQEQHAPGPNLLISDDKGLDTDWGYEPAPYVVVVDRSGKTAKKFTSGDHFTAEDVEKSALELLKK